MPEKDLDWLNDIDVEDLLNTDDAKDLRLVYLYLGKNFVKRLWETLPSIHIYVSTKPLEKAKRRYVKQHFNGHNVKELCLLLDVSERFVYNVLEERNQLVNQEPLFPSIS